MSGPTRQFVRHFAEMLVAMVVGMVALGPLWTMAFAALEWPPLHDHADLHALVMATNMTIGMSLWMRFRRHSWISVAEMAAAMYVPFAVLLVPFWTGALSASALFVAGHVLMFPCMVIAMLHRVDEYTLDHRMLHPVSPNRTTP